MKKFRHRLKKRYHSTDNLSAEWTKYDDRLIEYAGTGDVNKLRATLSKKGTSPIKWSTEGNTALHVTCALGHVECLEAMLEQNPDLNIADKTGASPLHVAADFGSYGCIEKLLEHQANIASHDDAKMTPLHRTARRGHMECVDLLVKYGAPVNSKDRDGRTPLLLAVQGGHNEVVNFLLDHGANTNSTDASLKTALVYASVIGLKSCVEILLRKGAKPYMTDASGHTAINYAHRNGFHDIVELIKNAPQVASWDLDDGAELEKEKEKEDTLSQNSEPVSKFNADDEISLASHPGTIEDSASVVLHHHTQSPTISYDQESLSSKASSKISHVTHMNNSRAVETIKELEEENDQLNQELDKLRLELQRAQKRIKQLEIDLASKQPEHHTETQVNGYLTSDNNEERLKELEVEVDELKGKLKKEVQHRVKLQEEADVLQAQLAAYQPEDVEADGIEMIFNEEEEEEFHLPGVDQDKENRKNKGQTNLAEVHLAESLKEQIKTLKLENQHLRGELNNNVQETITEDEPTIPLSVYQQLKESTSVEVEKLRHELAEANIKNKQMEGHQIKLAELEQRLNEETLNLSQVAALEEQVSVLQSQLMEADIEHNKTIAIYRLHLLSAVKGDMDSEVTNALQYLLRLRDSEAFC